MTIRIKKIYLDMDGVLSNFNKRWEELFFTPPKLATAKNYWKEFVATEQFKTLEPFPGWDLLIDRVESTGAAIEILTSSGGELNHDAVSSQKKFWLESHNITYPLNVVPGRRLKSNYANPSTLLIDDTLDVVMAFHEAGGYAIQHTDVKLTLPMLDNFFQDERVVWE